MTSLILTQEEVRELTGRVQYAAQARALNHMGIVHKIRADGAIVVLRSHLEHVLGVKAEVRKAAVEPNWAAAIGPDRTAMNRSAGMKRDRQ